MAHTEPPAHDTQAAPPPALIGALREIMGALVKLLLRHQITLPVVLGLLKEIYVQVAREELSVGGNPRQSDSRISLLTGVHRKDVKRLREVSPGDERVPASVQLGTRILSAWLSEAAFQEADGGPRPLARTGEDPEAPGFDQLVASVTTDLASGSVLEEWLRLGIAEILPDDRIRLRVEGFVPDQGFDEKAFYVGRNLRDHLATATNNLAGMSPMLERSVYYEERSEASVEELDGLAEELSMEALRNFNRRASALKRRDARRGEGRFRVTLGAFFFRGREDTDTALQADEDPGC